MKLLRLFLPADQIEATLRDATKLSRGYAFQLGGAPDEYRLLDLLPDPYPYFLFHPPRNELDNFIRKEYARDYRSSLHQLVLRPPRNLGLRLRAFRLRHDLTLVQTADLLGLSKSQLHRLERGERHPSAPTSFRILRLLTAPVSLAAVPEVSRLSRRQSREAKSRDSRHHYLEHLRLLTAHSLPSSGHGLLVPSEVEGSRAATSLRHSARGDLPHLAPGRSGRAGTETIPPTDHGTPACPERSRGATSHSALDSLRHLWLSGGLKTRELAATLGISQPYLIRLLRGDRQPSKKLLARISATLASV